jgi:hypothetical protein
MDLGTLVDWGLMLDAVDAPLAQHLPPIVSHTLASWKSAPENPQIRLLIIMLFYVKQFFGSVSKPTNIYF